MQRGLYVADPGDGSGGRSICISIFNRWGGRSTFQDLEVGQIVERHLIAGVVIALIAIQALRDVDTYPSDEVDLSCSARPSSS